MDQNNDDVLTKVLELIEASNNKDVSTNTYQNVASNPTLKTTSSVSVLLFVVAFFGYDKILDDMEEEILPIVKASVMEDLKEDRAALISSLDLDDKFEELEQRLDKIEDLSEEERGLLKKDLEELGRELQRLKIITEYTKRGD